MRGILVAMAVPLGLATAQIEEAKILLSKGQRRAALEKLDQAKTVAKTREQQRDIAEKRRIFVEQFLTAEAFQAYQEAKGLGDVGRWVECLGRLEVLPPGDRENLFVLRLQAKCQGAAGRPAEAAATLERILAFVPGDVKAGLDGVEIALAQGKGPQGLSALQGLQPRATEDIERYALLKARLLAAAGRTAEAEDVLLKDQQGHLEHVLVLYELASLYSRMPGHDWPARKYLSLFISRCKRLPEEDLRAREALSLLPKAQRLLSEIDRKLGV